MILCLFPFPENPTAMSCIAAQTKHYKSVSETEGSNSADPASKSSIGSHH
jgi:hypothetical protein